MSAEAIRTTVGMVNMVAAVVANPTIETSKAFFACSKGWRRDDDIGPSLYSKRCEPWMLERSDTKPQSAANASSEGLWARQALRLTRSLD